MKSSIIERAYPKNKGAAVFLIAMIFLCYGSVQGREEGENLAPLPKIFQPLAWEMNLREIGRFFPKAEIAETEYNTHQGKTKAIGIYGLKLKNFGDAMIGIEHDDYKKIKRVNIETTWSRHDYTDKLARVFSSLKKDLVAAYGPPRCPVRPVDSTDPREKECSWQGQGY